MEKPILDVRALAETYKKEAAIKSSCDIVLDLLFEMVEDNLLHQPEKFDFYSMSPKLLAELDKISSFFAPGKKPSDIAQIILDARQAFTATAATDSEHGDGTDTVIHLTNRRRLALIEKRIIRETRAKDPNCILYDTGPLFDEVLRQIKEEERQKKEQADKT